MRGLILFGLLVAVAVVAIVDIVDMTCHPEAYENV